MSGIPDHIVMDLDLTNELLYIAIDYVLNRHDIVMSELVEDSESVSELDDTLFQILDQWKDKVHAQGGDGEQFLRTIAELMARRKNKAKIQ